MWFFPIFIAAIIATLLWFILKKRYRLGFLSLMLWGATIMMLVDHLLGYEGGEFFARETNGIIKNGTLLGLVMLIPILLLWLGTLFISRFFKPHNNQTRFEDIR
ncbi:MAG: hypothetical protein ABIK93_01915 [candidate division WOR-3 bacterium]